jgi:hypothetical protein
MNFKITFYLTLLVLSFSALFGQHKKAPTEYIPGSAEERQPLAHKAGHSAYHASLLRQSAIPWNLVDSSGNALTCYSSTTQLAYSPVMNTLLFTHRGENSYTALPSGGGPPETWSNVSTDQGATWRRFRLPYNIGDNPVLGRYPAGEIFTPGGVKDTNTALAFMGMVDRYNNDTAHNVPILTGDIFLGQNYLGLTDSLNDNPYGGRITHNYAGKQVFDWHPPMVWSSKTGMFWAQAVRKDGNPVANWKGIAIYKSTNLNTLPATIIPTSLDTSKIFRIGTVLPGDAIEIAGGVTKMATGLLGSFYRRFNPTNSDSNIVGPYTIGVTYSTDEGSHWSLLDTVDLSQIPGLGQYRVMNFWDNYYI